MRLDKILPPSSTALERAQARAALPRALFDLAEAIVGIKTRRPEVYLPWLAAEWRLSEFTRYFPDLPSLIEAGLPWLKARGTAAAVKQALAWLEYTNVFLEQDGAVLQIDTGRIVAPERLADLIHVVTASIPAHVHLYRLYHGYDVRMIGFSCGERLGDGIYGDDSGVWIGGTKVSFGETVGISAATEGITAGFAAHECAYFGTDYLDAPRWGLFQWGDDFPRNYLIAERDVGGFSNNDRNAVFATDYPVEGGWDGRAAFGNVSFSEH